VIIGQKERRRILQVTGEEKSINKRLYMGAEIALISATQPGRTRSLSYGADIAGRCYIEQQQNKKRIKSRLQPYKFKVHTNNDGKTFIYP